MSEDAIAQILAQLIGGKDPRIERQEMASAATRDHIISGRPTPAAGQKIRCVYSLNQKAFENDKIIFEEGRVYEVVLTGWPAFEHRANLEDCGEPRVEELAKIKENMERTIAERPTAEGSTLWVKDPQTGNETAITFPGFPTAFFVLAADDDVDEPQRHDLEEGQPVQFSEITIVGEGNFTVGKNYAATNRRAACDCPDPACPGKTHTIYDIYDDNGELACFSLPFSPFGISRPVTN